MVPIDGQWKNPLIEVKTEVCNTWSQSTFAEASLEKVEASDRRVSNRPPRHPTRLKLLLMFFNGSQVQIFQSFSRSYIITFPAELYSAELFSAELFSAELFSAELFSAVLCNNFSAELCNNFSRLMHTALRVHSRYWSHLNFATIFPSRTFLGRILQQFSTELFGQIWQHFGPNFASFSWQNFVTSLFIFCWPILLLLIKDFYCHFCQFWFEIYFCWLRVQSQTYPFENFWNTPFCFWKAKHFVDWEFTHK